VDWKALGRYICNRVYTLSDMSYPTLGVTTDCGLKSFQG